MIEGSIVKEGSNTIILDSLPYVDSTHEDYEDYALALIEEEMKLLPTQLGDRVAPVRFRSVLMRQEYNSLIVENEFRARQALSFQPEKIARPGTDEEWIVGLKNIKSRHESERIRGMILEASKEEAVSIWKAYNTGLQCHKVFWESAFQKEKETVEEINYQRQQTQQHQLGPQLGSLEADYQQALYRRNQLAYAIEAQRRS
eukprot:scaffold22577_cov122-Cylindrotheca_fusiformis.AAC.16